MDCQQDKINEVWRHYVSYGISDDIVIIEELAGLLLYLKSKGLDYFQYQDRHSKRALEFLVSMLDSVDDAANLLNQCLIMQAKEMRAGGRYPTVRHIAKLVASLSTALLPLYQPRTVGDFACGSGGMLVEFEQASERIGIEIATLWGSIAKANLQLHGFDHSKIFIGDALSIVNEGFAPNSVFRVFNPDKKTDIQFDIIAMNPPFGNPMERAFSSLLFNEDVGSRSETILTLLALDYLCEDGVLAVLLPGGSLFATSTGELRLRQRLLSEFQLDAVIELPKDALQPFSQLQTYLVLASKRDPELDDASICFYRITHDGFTSGRNRREDSKGSQFPLLQSSLILDDVIKTSILENEFRLAFLYLEGKGWRIETSKPVNILVGDLEEEPGRIVVSIEGSDQRYILFPRNPKPVHAPWLNTEKLDIFLHSSYVQNVTGIIIDLKGYWLGVSVDRSTVLSDSRLDLQPATYLPRQAADQQRYSPAEILASVRIKQRLYASSIDKLLHVVESKTKRTLPLSVDKTIPPYPLTSTQLAIWQQIEAQVETLNGNLTPIPFQPDSLKGRQQEIVQTLMLLECMGLIVPITFGKDAYYYRRVTQEDLIPA
ncbi:MAG: HsdM family class I SAM-dependent methyltransferase [Candidatus Promineifilaceae bacterium]